MELRVCDNLERLGAMAKKIWINHYPDIIGAEQTAYMLQRNYNLPALEQQQADGQQFYWICDDGGSEIGFMGISKSASDGLFIHKFYILPEAQGKGIGKRAFQLLISSFPDTSSITLQVNRQNYKSINFYFTLGFKIVRVADFDIGEGWQMNDFIMQWMRM